MDVEWIDSRGGIKGGEAIAQCTASSVYMMNATEAPGGYVSSLNDNTAAKE